MERRHQPRLECNRRVRITVLGEKESTFSGRLANVSGTGMRLLVNRPIREGSVLKVEYGETLYLGEVCYCQPQQRGYAAGIMLEHSLVCTDELAKLARQLQAQSAPQPRTLQPQPVNRKRP